MDNHISNYIKIEFFSVRQTIHQKSLTVNLVIFAVD